VRWRRASRSELPPIGAEVWYDWPDGGGAPFDTSADETHWVLEASGRLGRTWPAGDLMDFGSWDPSFEHRVPVGYKTIAAVERLAVVVEGTVVREWPGTRYHPAGTTYVAEDGQGGEKDPDGRWISHAHETYEDALADAKGMKDRRVLVGRVLVSASWH
jgi:hypothetical protein